MRKTRKSLKQFGFLVEQACLPGGFDDVRGQDVVEQQGRGRVVPAVVLQRLAVVFVGVAVAASVRAGVVVPQSAALHAGTMHFFQRITIISMHFFQRILYVLTHFFKRICQTLSFLLSFRVTSRPLIFFLIGCCVELSSHLP